MLLYALDVDDHLQMMDQLWVPKCPLLQPMHVPICSCMAITLNMTFSVTYYLEIHNAMYVHYKSCILPTNVELVV